MRRRFSLFSVLLCLGCFIVMLFTTACRQPSSSSSSSSSQTQAPPHVVDVPDFNADSAFAYVERQVAFGPRVPNTPAHRNAAEYLATELRRHGAQVVLQDFRVRAYDGTMLDACNIIASYSPEKKDRVLLFAHWDTRPYADNDPQQKNHRLPIDGANDGASGVAVLLETARQIHARSPRIGIDIIFFDVEDYGRPYFSDRPEQGDSWALAPGIVDKVWKAAQSLGYGDYFVDERGGYINDDHVYVGRRVPSIDIIAYDESQGGFVPQWHTLDDTLENIDKGTLKAVGQTLLWVIYNE